MNKTISATAARRQLARLLARAHAGETFVVTLRGVPVAKVIPFDAEQDNGKARRQLLQRLRSQPAINAGLWTRDELYDDE